jgi:flavorubredoxin
MSTHTRIDEIAEGIYRISTAIPPEAMPGGFTFNQFLIAADEPLLYHTGLRRIFPDVCTAIERVLPISRLRHVAFSHYEEIPAHLAERVIKEAEAAKAAKA